MNNKLTRHSSITESKNSVTCENAEGSALGKLRRLKMQEKIFTNKINVNLNKLDIQTLDFNRKLLFANINKSFIEIKNIFEDVKHNSSARNMSNIDVDQIKNDVLTLEERIRDLKKFLHSEITELTNVELTIAKEVHELKEIEQPKPKTATLRKLKSFNDIVPSPVRAIIHTPYKYKEVQNLHEYLSESGGKYGGWHEFNHILFLQSRQKYVFSKDNMAKYEIELKSFVDDLLIKIPGTSIEKIIEHEKWYLKLTELQKQQQEALNRWKQNKKCVKSSYHISQRPTQQSNTTGIKDRTVNTKENYTLKKSPKSTDNGNVKSPILDNTGNTKASNLLSYKSDASDVTEEYSENGSDVDAILDSQGSRVSKTNTSRNKYRYMDPTRVWINRNMQKETEITTNTHYFTLNTIKKIGIPVWRQGLQ